MNSLIRKYWITLLVSVVASFSIAQTNFTTKVSATKIGIDNSFNVTYTANKKGNFIAPKFTNFKVLGGPSQGSSSNISIVNGSMTQTTSYSYTYTLTPNKIGTFNVPGAQIKVDNATFEAKPVQVTVVKESQAQQRQQRRSVFDQMDEMMSGGQQQQQGFDEKSFFNRITLSKSKAYVGEPIIVTYKIYSRGHTIQLEDYDFPTHEDFWTENIKLPEQIKPTNEIVDGLQYQVFTLKQEVLFPQNSGKKQLKAFSVTARLDRSFFGNGLQKKITSSSPQVIIDNLPQGAPSSFKNQVGNYMFNATISSDTVKVNEPIDLKIIIKGKGNLKQLNEFNIEFPTDLEDFDPEIKNNVNINSAGISGAKGFNYLVIPRHSGTFEFGPLEFSYFDLNTKTYKTLTSKKFTITVLKEDGSIDNNNTASLNKTEVELLNTKINYIKKEANFKSKGNYFFNSFGYYALIVLLGGLFIAFFFVNKKIKESNLDTDVNRVKKANKHLIKKLAIAKDFLDHKETTKFYDETLAALYKYVNDKLLIETSQLSKINIKQKLLNKSVNEPTVKKLIEILETCEMSRFASLSEVNNQEVYTKSVEVINQIEHEFKNVN
jgi:hypothetical protein